MHYAKVVVESLACSLISSLTCVRFESISKGSCPQACDLVATKSQRLEGDAVAPGLLLPLLPSLLPLLLLPWGEVHFLSALPFPAAPLQAHLRGRDPKVKHGAELAMTNLLCETGRLNCCGVIYNS